MPADVPSPEKIRSIEPFYMRYGEGSIWDAVNSTEAFKAYLERFISLAFNKAIVEDIREEDIHMFDLALMRYCFLIAQSDLDACKKQFELLGNALSNLSSITQSLWSMAGSQTGSVRNDFSFLLTSVPTHRTLIANHKWLENAHQSLRLFASIHHPGEYLRNNRTFDAEQQCDALVAIARRPLFSTHQNPVQDVGNALGASMRYLKLGSIAPPKKKTATEQRMLDIAMIHKDFMTSSAQAPGISRESFMYMNLLYHYVDEGVFAHGQDVAGEASSIVASMLTTANWRLFLKATLPYPWGDFLPVAPYGKPPFPLSVASTLAQCMYDDPSFSPTLMIHPQAILPIMPFPYWIETKDFSDEFLVLLYRVFVTQDKNIESLAVRVSSAHVFRDPTLVACLASSHSIVEFNPENVHIDNHARAIGLAFNKEASCYVCASKDHEYALLQALIDDGTDYARFTLTSLDVGKMNALRIPSGKAFTVMIAHEARSVPIVQITLTEHGIEYQAGNVACDGHLSRLLSNVCSVVHSAQDLVSCKPQRMPILVQPDEGIPDILDRLAESFADENVEGQLWVIVVDESAQPTEDWLVTKRGRVQGYLSAAHAQEMDAVTPPLAALDGELSTGTNAPVLNIQRALPNVPAELYAETEALLTGDRVIERRSSSRSSSGAATPTA